MLSGPKIPISSQVLDLLKGTSNTNHSLKHAFYAVLFVPSCVAHQLNSSTIRPPRALFCTNNPRKT